MNTIHEQNFFVPNAWICIFKCGKERNNEQRKLKEIPIKWNKETTTKNKRTHWFRNIESSSVGNSMNNWKFRVIHAKPCTDYLLFIDSNSNWFWINVRYVNLSQKWRCSYKYRVYRISNSNHINLTESSYHVHSQCIECLRLRLYIRLWIHFTIVFQMEHSFHNNKKNSIPKWAKFKSLLFVVFFCFLLFHVVIMYVYTAQFGNFHNRESEEQRKMIL